MRSERPHKRLDAWQKAVDLVTQVYQATRQFPSSEQFGLAAQMRRAAVSMPSNIAEGAARKSGKEFLQFLYTARASASELDTQLEIATRLEYLPPATAQALLKHLDHVSRLLNGLIASVSRRNS
jgi:four helix bundle protein